jgi:hypothetical protein
VSYVKDRAMMCVKQAKATWGKAWSLLSEHQRRAEVALVVCKMLVANDEEDNPFGRAGSIAYRAMEEVTYTEKTDARFIAPPKGA